MGDLLARGSLGWPLSPGEIARQPASRAAAAMWRELGLALLERPQWTLEEITQLAQLGVALRRVFPRLYQQILAELQARVEDALGQADGACGLSHLAMALAHLASPAARVERLLAMAHLTHGVRTELLNRYPVSARLEVDFRPEPIHEARRDQIEAEFRGARVVIVEPHPDDAVFFLGGAMTRIASAARCTVLVTVTLDPAGVTDAFAERMVRRRGRPLPKTPGAWERAKAVLRRQEIRAVAAALGIQSVVLHDPVRVVRGRADAAGRLLSYHSTFTPLAASTLQRLRRLLQCVEPTAIFLPLPRAHYHQTHRDTARLVLQAVYHRHVTTFGRRPPALYFYSDGLMDLFSGYGFRANVVYFYGRRAQARKQALVAMIRSQVARNPRYPAEIRAKDRQIAALERARLATEGGGRGGRGALYAEQLLKVTMVPRRHFCDAANLTPYDPFGLLPGRYFCRENGRGAESSLVRMECGEVVAVWRLPPGGLKPGHGLFLAEHLEVGREDTLVDLGTGPLGFLGMWGAYRGAPRVVAIDSNPAFVRMAQASVAFSGLGTKVRVLRGNLFDPLGNSAEFRRVTKAVIHPPMLPALRPAGARRVMGYDDGGLTGRAVLDRAIAQAARRLVAGGELLIGQFEFLGVERAFGSPPATFAVLRRHGFQPRVVARYEVPATPMLQRRMPRIRTLYADYPFVSRHGALWHRFVIVSGRRPAAYTASAETS